MVLEDPTTLYAEKSPPDFRRIYAVVRVMQGEEVDREYRLRDSSHIIGRDIKADLHLPLDYVSRRHAKIEVKYLDETKTFRYILTDLSSRNSTYVNTELAGETVLEDGDKIVIGDTIFRFELLDEIDLKFHKDIQRKIQYDNLTQLLTKEAFITALDREMVR